MKTADKELGATSPLEVCNVTTDEWEGILPSCHVEELRLYHITLKSLDGIETLVETRDLTLEWATKIESLAPVFRMRDLTKLSVFDFPRVRSLSGIKALSNITELNLSGNRASLKPPLRLTTIEPVTRIPNLMSLSLTNARLEDDDITPLACCTKLRRLHLSLRFEKKATRIPSESSERAARDADHAAHGVESSLQAMRLREIHVRRLPDADTLPGL